MSRYRVEIARRALKALSTLPRKDQQRVRAVIDLLGDNPRPPGCVALAGEEHAYRVRSGDYRVVYEVLDDRLVVQVVRVGHRRNVFAHDPKRESVASPIQSKVPLAAGEGHPRDASFSPERGCPPRSMTRIWRRDAGWRRWSPSG